MVERLFEWMKQEEMPSIEGIISKIELDQEDVETDSIRLDIYKYELSIKLEEDNNEYFLKNLPIRIDAGELIRIYYLDRNVKTEKDVVGFQILDSNHNMKFQYKNSGSYRYQCVTED
ncbi:hypothetical protein ACFL1H_03875 [Nanoarchaeota archaeon]